MLAGHVEGRPPASRLDLVDEQRRRRRPVDEHAPHRRRATPRGARCSAPRRRGAGERRTAPPSRRVRPPSTTIAAVRRGPLLRRPPRPRAPRAARSACSASLSRSATSSASTARPAPASRAPRPCRASTSRPRRRASSGRRGWSRRSRWPRGARSPSTIAHAHPLRVDDEVRRELPGRARVQPLVVLEARADAGDPVASPRPRVVSPTTSNVGARRSTRWRPVSLTPMRASAGSVRAGPAPERDLLAVDAARRLRDVVDRPTRASSRASRRTAPHSERRRDAPARAHGAERGPPRRARGTRAR